jgi:hypothetical protein
VTYFKPLVIALVLSIGLLKLIAGPGDAFAGTTACRTDPVVTLSSGVTVTMAATIYDTQSDIQKVVYVLHAPSGVTVTGITWPNDSLSSRESVQYFADNTTGHYTTQTTVTTETKGVKVSATTQARTSTTSISATVSGTSGSAITVSVAL